jgi:hypothetical protein
MKRKIYVIGKDMQIKNITPFLIISILLINALMFSVGYHSKETTNINMLTSTEEKIILIKANEIKNNNFTPKELREYLYDLNIKYPWIAYSQALIESAHFTSPVWRNNHNLIGMKKSTLRATKNKGTELNHAYFDNWKDCVDDYALWYNRYRICDLNEKQYMEFLQKNYAESTEYLKLLNKIIPTVKHLFNTNAEKIEISDELVKEIDEYYKQVK